MPEGGADDCVDDRGKPRAVPASPLWTVIVAHAVLGRVAPGDSIPVRIASIRTVMLFLLQSETGIIPRGTLPPPGLAGRRRGPGMPSPRTDRRQRGRRAPDDVVQPPLAVAPRGVFLSLQDCTPEAFEHRINAETPLAVLDGYAPFCKLHAHRDWTSMKMKQRTAISNQTRKVDRFVGYMTPSAYAPYEEWPLSTLGQTRRHEINEFTLVHNPTQTKSK